MRPSPPGSESAPRPTAGVADLLLLRPGVRRETEGFTDLPPTVTSALRTAQYWCPVGTALRDSMCCGQTRHPSIKKVLLQRSTAFSLFRKQLPPSEKGEQTLPGEPDLPSGSIPSGELRARAVLVTPHGSARPRRRSWTSASMTTRSAERKEKPSHTVQTGCPSAGGAAVLGSRLGALMAT